MEIIVLTLVEVVYQIGVNYMNWYKKAQLGRNRTSGYTMAWTLPDESPWGELDVNILFDVEEGEARSWDSPGYGASAEAYKVTNYATGEDMTQAIDQWNPRYLADEGLEEMLLEYAGEHDTGLADAAADAKMDQMREEGHGLI